MLINQNPEESVSVNPTCQSYSPKPIAQTPMEVLDEMERRLGKSIAFSPVELRSLYKEELVNGEVVGRTDDEKFFQLIREKAKEIQCETASLAILQINPGSNELLIDNPPRLPEQILFFLAPRKQRDDMIDHLRNDYTQAIAELGPHAAKIYYCKEVAVSLLPVTGRLIEVLLKWGGLDWIRQHWMP